jgi:hypothetical protein
MSYENHRATRALVDYAGTHRRAVVMERLEGLRSKIPVSFSTLFEVNFSGISDMLHGMLTWLVGCEN